MILKERVSSLDFRYEKVDYYRNNDTARMPTFADMTGFDDCQSEKTKELLRLIMAGNIKDNEHIAMLKEKSITELQKRRKNLGGSPRINRIIAVCSCDPDSNLPRSLFSAIIEIAKERGYIFYIFIIEFFVYHKYQYFNRHNTYR